MNQNNQPKFNELDTIEITLLVRLFKGIFLEYCNINKSWDDNFIQEQNRVTYGGYKFLWPAAIAGNCALLSNDQSVSKICRYIHMHYRCIDYFIILTVFKYY